MTTTGTGTGTGTGTTDDGGDPEATRDPAAAPDPAPAATVTEAQAASLRERKKRATRTALRRAAVRLVARRGLAAVTVEDIAADAGVSPRTFFNYFSSKEDAVSGWDPAVLAEMVEHLRSRPAGEPAPAALRTALLDAWSPSGADHRDLLERLRVTRSDPHLLAHHVSCWSETEHQLVTTLAERRGTDPAHDHYAALVVATMLTVVRVALMSWCDGKGRTSLVEEVAFQLDVLGAGLADPAGSATR